MICPIVPFPVTLSKGATSGGRGVRTPQFSGGPPNFWHNVFVGGVHRQASRVNSVYSTEEERKKEFFLLILQSVVYCNIFNICEIVYVPNVG